MSFVRPTTDPIRQTKDFETTPAPQGGGGLAWMPEKDTVRARVATAAVSKYDLCVFDFVGTRDITVFDKTNPLNFVRPHDVTIAAGANAGEDAGLGTITFGATIDGETIQVADDVGTYIFRFSDPAGAFTETRFSREVDVSGGATAANSEVAFRAAANAAGCLMHITAVAATSTTCELEADFPGTRFNNTITEQTANCTVTGMTGGTNPVSMALYCLALEDAAVGERCHVLLSGLGRANSAAGVLNGDYLVATNGATTVERKATIANAPRLVIGRALEVRHTDADTTLDEHNTVWCMFNGIRGLGTNIEVYA